MSTAPATFSIDVTLTSRFADPAAFVDFAARLRDLVSAFAVPMKLSAKNETPAEQPAAVRFMPAPVATETPAEQPAPAATETPAPAGTEPKRKVGRPRKPDADAATAAAPAMPADASASEAPSGSAAVPETPAAAAAAAPAGAAMTLDQLRERVTTLCREKPSRAVGLVSILKKFKVARASDIPEGERAAFVAEIEAMQN